MTPDVYTLLEKRGALIDYAQELRSQGHNQHNDMLTLAKILSRQSQLEMQLSVLGVTIAPDDTQPMTTDETCPF